MQRLALDRNQLSGTIPSLAGLFALTTLHMMSNHLSGTLPGFDDNFNLQYLNVGNNSLTALHPTPYFPSHSDLIPNDFYCPVEAGWEETFHSQLHDRCVPHLKSLNVLPGVVTPLVSLDTDEYYAFIVFSAFPTLKSVIVEASPIDPLSEIELQDGTRLTGPTKVPISGNYSTFSLAVVASGALKRKEYAIHVTRGPSTADATLQVLNTTYALEPPFEMLMTQYLVTVTDDVENVSVSGVPSISGSMISINGVVNDSVLIQLLAQDTTVNVTVTAIDQKTQKDYCITFRKPEDLGTNQDSALLYTFLALCSCAGLVVLRACLWPKGRRLDRQPLLGRRYQSQSFRAPSQVVAPVNPEQPADAPDFEDSDEDQYCSICLENPRTHVIIDCGHRCVCEQCAESLPACPLCRVQISRVIKVYM